ncbi:hypothetical protein [Neobacillus sp. SuZ13]|uniref:hypothetical protein n=1 Tax=Neobacillus sp. SuZ13 TaxID=3047875 RepID=UPI0024C0D7E0|nr:hypothetical protein [Neobacillus sp. SuZ13]WHY68942.1 hypothetical protein QNH17_10045 [Neobacillus sp. SuZ13]
MHETVWRAGNTGLTGFLSEPTQIVDGNFDVENGNGTLPVQTDNLESYYALGAWGIALLASYILNKTDNETLY